MEEDFPLSLADASFPLLKKYIFPFFRSACWLSHSPSLSLAKLHPALRVSMDYLIRKQSLKLRYQSTLPSHLLLHISRLPNDALMTNRQRVDKNNICRRKKITRGVWRWWMTDVSSTPSFPSNTPHHLNQPLSPPPSVSHIKHKSI
jgi:hypothetical protein